MIKEASRLNIKSTQRYNKSDMKKLITIILCFLLISGCAKGNSFKPNKEKTFLGSIQDINGDMVLLLNTDTYITTVNPKYKDELITKSKDLITKYHMLLDSHHHYLDDNDNQIVNIRTLNENIDNGPVKVDPIIIDAIKEAKTLVQLTQGYFNFTIGKVSDLYHDKLLPYDSTNVDPGTKDIKYALDGIINADELDKYIVIDEIKNTVELKSKENCLFKIDLGAFSKGYILNKVYEELIKYDTSFLLSAGSSSIITYSNMNEDVSWNVAIKNPNNLDKQLLAFTLKSGAISTSGDYENYYFLEDNTRRHHILNPYTGYPENYYRSNTLVSSNACLVDALSTALFNVKDVNTRQEILNDASKYCREQVNYCFVGKDIDLVMNQGFHDILIDEYTSKDINNITIK